MYFIQAIKKASSGVSVRRYDWPREYRVRANRMGALNIILYKTVLLDCMTGLSSNQVEYMQYKPNVDDVLAGDWEVFEE